MFHSDTWNVPSPKDPNVNWTPGGGSKDDSTDGSKDGSKPKDDGASGGCFKPRDGITRKCFNCDSEEHLLPDCPKAQNETKIAAERAKLPPSRFAKWKADKRAHLAEKERQIQDGIPMMKDRTGTWVRDQSAFHANLLAADREKILAKVADAMQDSVPESSPPEPSSAKVSFATATTKAERLELLRAAALR